MASLHQRKFALADAQVCVHPECSDPADAVSVTVAVFDDGAPVIKVQPMCWEHMREVDAVYDRAEQAMEAKRGQAKRSAGSNRRPRRERP